MQGPHHSSIWYVASVGTKCVATANHTMTVIMLVVNVAAYIHTTTGSVEPLGEGYKCGLYNACTMKIDDILL